MKADQRDFFQHRHIGPRTSDIRTMLETIGVNSMEELIEQTVPEDIRLTTPLDLPAATPEASHLHHMKKKGARNRTFQSFIGTGYYPCITPSVVLRNVLENPSWYTPYTPYQAEIAQGRLEALLNFQTATIELTGMDVANASLLDEATAAAEAMTFLYRLQRKRLKKSDSKPTLIISQHLFPQTLDVLRCRAEPLGIELLLADNLPENCGPEVFGWLLQNPNEKGAVQDLTQDIAVAQKEGILVAVATDLLACTLIKPPGEMGADVVFGSAQRFGVPMGYGGPHAAFFATHHKYVREMPGRIIGVSVDANGHPAYRMALQTREQHIRREKAKSNICTAQALLANVAGFYAVYHGPHGLRAIGERVHRLTTQLAEGLKQLGFDRTPGGFFDTIHVHAQKDTTRIEQAGLEMGMNFRLIDASHFCISLDETTTHQDVINILNVFAAGAEKSFVEELSDDASSLPTSLVRSTLYLKQETFNRYHSETEMMRYMKLLERKDLGLDTAMIPLGSCTMKLNAATQMMPITWPEFANLHPFAPTDQARGYHEIFSSLEKALCSITGFQAVSLQPNSGAQGEFTGLMVIRAYLRGRGEPQRTVVLIPASAHGTNPATATMVGMDVVVVACDENGNVDLEDLRRLANAHKDRLAALMITYPSTHGVFEEPIREICSIIHECGGQVYMDGANLNAQVGLTNPALIGADVCHINLHKTFSIPHGGGGPGMGPIAVAAHLADFLPGHSQTATGGSKAIPSVSAAPWGSAAILLISYAYIRLLGRDGVTAATQYAILNANYIKARLSEHFDVLFTGPNDRVAHEMIFDLRPFKAPSGIDETDVAKRLMDYGFHAPTVSWPVPGTMMIEPTESEPKSELDRFCEALISIRKEIQEVIDGKADRKDNVLKNAPHTAEMVTEDIWEHCYSREQAVYPLPYLKQNKFWPAVTRIDNPYGDRNLVCSCPSIENYEEPVPNGKRA